jgi:L-fucose mutarotase
MMLKGVPHFMDAELLWVLASMGHGDELAVVDRNFSGPRVAKETTSGKLIILNGVNATDAIAGILSLLPLDGLVDCREVEGRNIVSKPIERFAYYPIAQSCFAVIQTSEDRPYANFILKKGVV